jgi:pimeloyl-ACP methyl ester carboxylesterase
MPILLLLETDTTLAARAVVEILRGLWPRAQYVEIAHAGHLAPITHAAVVNPIIAAFLMQATQPS